MNVKYVCSRCNKTLSSRQSLRYHEQRRFPCKAATSTVAVDTEMQQLSAHQEAVQSSFDSCKKKMLSVIGKCFVHYRNDSMVVTILCDLITLVEDICS